MVEKYYNENGELGVLTPHTCDICTSLDQDEEYSMWEAKNNEQHK